MFKRKKEKKKHLLGTKEFIFNFLSLVMLIGIGIYFGYRSLYYYSKQNVKIKEEAMTLNGLIVQNNYVAKEDNDGLHQDSEGYYFKGKVENNYVLFSNRVFRVVRINNNNTVKMITENVNASFMWGEDSKYENSNVRNWLEKSDKEHTGIYYNTIANADKMLVKTSYQEDILKEDKIENSENTSKDYVTILSVKDYTLANGKNSYLNNGKVFYLLGLNGENENLYVEEDGSIQSTDSLSGFGIRPVITLAKNTIVSSGSGTKDDPYVIKEDTKNYVNTYVKLGEDIWKVSSENGDILRLYLNGYLKINGQEIVRNYSVTNSIFDVTDRNNIANYLNVVYYNSLSYQGALADCDFYTGEISDDAGYSFTNIYNNKAVVKVGLLNIFDNIDNDLSDYFHVNLTSEVGSMEYNRYSNGILEEADVRDEKHIVPSVCISKSVIKSGNGTLDNPYILG